AARGAGPEAARAILDAAVRELGGPERLAKLDHWVVQGTGRENLSGELQGLTSDEPTFRPHEEAVGIVRAEGAVAWQRRTPRNDQSLRWRRFIYKPGAFGVVDFNAGWGALRPRATSEADRLGLMRRVPHLLLEDAARHATPVEARGERRTADGLRDGIAVALPGQAALTLWIRREPRLLERVEYTLDLPGLGETVVAWEFSGWKKDAALGWAPSGHRIEVGGTLFQEVRYARFAAGETEAARELVSIPKNLTPPVRAAQTAPPSAGPATGEVAPGVHVASVRGFVSLFTGVAH